MYFICCLFIVDTELPTSKVIVQYGWKLSLETGSCRKAVSTKAQEDNIG